MASFDGLLGGCRSCDALGLTNAQHLTHASDDANVVRNLQEQLRDDLFVSKNCTSAFKSLMRANTEFATASAHVYSLDNENASRRLEANSLKNLRNAQVKLTEHFRRACVTK